MERGTRQECIKIKKKGTSRKLDLLMQTWSRWNACICANLANYTDESWWPQISRLNLRFLFVVDGVCGIFVSVFFLFVCFACQFMLYCLCTMGADRKHREPLAHMSTFWHDDVVADNSRHILHTITEYSWNNWCRLTNVRSTKKHSEVRHRLHKRVRFTCSHHGVLAAQR